MEHYLKEGGQASLQMLGGAANVDTEDTYLVNGLKIGLARAYQLLLIS
jgi:hypothetical protein